MERHIMMCKKRCTWRGKRMWTLPIGPSVELPMRPRNAALGGGNACGHATGAFGAPFGPTKRCTGLERR
eukprot:3681250-Pyramimonas_sp.AAC.1